MATYTTLDPKSVDTLLAHYDIGKVDSHVPLDGGAANSSILLTASTGRYVLSVCDEKSTDEITTLTATLELLSDHDFPTTRLVKTSDGKPFTNYQGKPVYLKHFIDGEVKEPLDTEMLYQVGTALASLHAVPPADFLPQTFSYGIECFPEVFGRHGVFPAWLKEKTANLQTCCHGDLPTGLIHGDLFYDNILFNGHVLAALLDFEEVCNSFLIFDLGMCAAGCCCPNGTFSLESTAALIRGYQSKRKLTGLERKHLQCHVEYGAIATAFWRYRQFNIVIPTAERKESYLEMKNLADKVHAISTKEFNRAVFGS